MTEDKILTIANKKEEKVLRKRPAAFKFSVSPKHIRELITRMRNAMKKANGVGLSANQIGVDAQVFVAYVPQQEGGYKFYAIFNPKIEKVSKETVGGEEGCLSIPGVYGDVERPEKISITGFDKNGKPLKIKAWGLLARVFQHEIDHLNGALFIDRTKHLHYDEALWDKNRKALAK